MVVVILPPRHHWISKGGTMIDYVKEVNNYGRSLTPNSKNAAREVFSQLLSCGYDYEWLYFAIQRLGDRDIARHQGLFFYKPFQQEVNERVAAHREEEEWRKQESARICAAIEQQIQQRKQQRVIDVRVPKVKRKYPTAAETLAAIVSMEDDV